jgi:hypothetical protein
MVAAEGAAPPKPRWAPLADQAAELLAQAANSGKPLDTDAALAELEKLAVRLLALDALQQGATRLDQILVAELDQVLLDNIDALFASLSQQAATAVAEGRGIADIGQLSAEQIVGSGNDIAWTRYRELRAAYADAFRAAGMASARLGERLSLYPELLRLANPDQTMRGWAQWHRAGGLVDDRGNVVPLSPPWPTEEQSDRPAHSDEMWFDWFCRTPEAEPWTPSRAQLEQRSAQLEELVFNADTTPIKKVGGMAAMRARANAGRAGEQAFG